MLGFEWSNKEHPPLHPSLELRVRCRSQVDGDQSKYYERNSREKVALELWPGQLTNTLPLNRLALSLAGQRPHREGVRGVGAMGA